MNTSSFQSTAYNHAGQTQIIGTSGLKIFEGQDLTAGDRKRLQQLQQSYWLKKQIQEKEKKKNQDKCQKQSYDQQTIQINEYRKQLEQQKSNRLKNMEVAYRNFNLEQLEQKLNKQSLQRKLDDQQRFNHIQYITGDDFYTQNPKTCQSELNKNRVKFYHWKGMSDDQKKQILEQQEKQRRQKQLKNQLQKQEQKLFAQQMQAQRKAIVLQDRANNKGSQNLRKGVDEYNKLKAEQMKRKAFWAYDKVQTYKNEG